MSMAQELRHGLTRSCASGRVTGYNKGASQAALLSGILFQACADVGGIHLFEEL